MIRAISSEFKLYTELSVKLEGFLLCIWTLVFGVKGSIPALPEGVHAVAAPTGVFHMQLHI